MQTTKEEFLAFLKEQLESLKKEDVDEDDKYSTAKPIKFKSEDEALDHIQSIMRSKPGTRMVMHTTDGDKEVVFWKFDDEAGRAVAYYPVLGHGYTRCATMISAISVLK